MPAATMLSAARRHIATPAADKPPLPPPASARHGHGSPLGGSAASLAGSEAAASAAAGPRTPETALSGVARATPTPTPRSTRSTRSGSATPSDDNTTASASLTSGVTSSFSSAADVSLFAPASTEDAVHAVPSLLSQLMSGRTDEQVLAARKLHAYCRHSGAPVESAIAAAGGVHMLLIMLDSLDKNLRDVCTRILTDMAADDRIRSEILTAPGGTAKVIQLMYKGILDGQASAGRFLELLAGSSDEAVQAALCHSKVVRMLCKTLEGAATPRARGAALSALQAFCRQDASNLRKLVWSGGVDALLGVLQSGEAAQHGPALQLLGAAVRLQADTAGSLSTVVGVATLSQFVGVPEQPAEVQAEAADILAEVAAIPVKREGVQQALTDHALPRAFEILHEASTQLEQEDCSSGGSGAGASAVAATGKQQQEQQRRRRLQAAAAAIVAQLVQQDKECCHSILFHAQLLRPAVQVLISGGRCAAAQQLLAAAKAYAEGLGGGSSSGIAYGGTSGSAPPTPVLA